MSEVLTFGETLVGFRTEGSLRLPGRLQADVRGAESNVAIGLARLGHSVAWVSRVSVDAYGDEVLRALRSEGVDVGGVVRDERPTGLMLIQQRTADVAVVEYRRAGSAASGLVAADVRWVEAPRLLHVTGITPALSDSCREAVVDAAERARADGALVTFDVNYRATLWSRERASEVLREVVPYADVVIAGEDELSLVGSADELLELGVHEVVIKRGSAGATSVSSEGSWEEPAVSVTVVDPIGAGDAFCAGWISAWLEGASVAARMRRGVVCGSFAVSTYGDTAGLPRRSELGLLGAADTTVR